VSYQTLQEVSFDLTLAMDPADGKTGALLNLLNAEFSSSRVVSASARDDDASYAK
jgi:hypothetical protein